MSDSTRSDDAPENPRPRRPRDESGSEPESTGKPAKPRRPEGQWGVRVLVLLCGLVAASSSTAFAHFWQEEQSRFKDKIEVARMLKGLDGSGKVEKELADFD